MDCLLPSIHLIELLQHGVWIIKTVHMHEHSADDADWISYWASLTFDNVTESFTRNREWISGGDFVTPTIFAHTLVSD